MYTPILVLRIAKYKMGEHQVSVEVSVLCCHVIHVPVTNAPWKPFAIWYKVLFEENFLLVF